MSELCSFKFSHLKTIFQTALDNDYKVITCRDYVTYKKNKSSHKALINRVDVDLTCIKAKILAQIFNELSIKATFFVRLHAPEYNPFSFENFRCLRYIRDTGHEIGLHSEVVDISNIWAEDAEACLRRDIETINTMLDIQVVGIASHGGATGYNNLDFWQNRTPKEFGMLYEAFDTEPEYNLFQESLYLSDSNFTYWKSYDKGVLQDDRRCCCKYFPEGHQIIQSLVHPVHYYYEHFHELD